MYKAKVSSRIPRWLIDNSNHLNLPEIASTLDNLESVVTSPGKYRRFPLTKKSGGVRWISEPLPEIKAAQRKYLSMIPIPILEQTTSRGTHQVITGFMPGMSIVDNARPHVGQKVVLSMDLKDFFGSVRPIDLPGFYRSDYMRYSSQPPMGSLLVSLLFTNKGLPQGSPASPMLANWAAASGDIVVLNTLDKLGLDIAYTRYADDLTFSGDEIPEEFVQGLVSAASGIFFKHAKFANNKIKFMRRHKRQIVTGIVVNEKLSIPRERRMKLRAIKHRIETKGIDSVDQSFHEVLGELSYLHLTDKQKARDMINMLLAL